MADLNLVDGYLYYVARIQSMELVHYLFSWLGGHLAIEKNIFYALFNGLLAYLFLEYCNRNNVSVWIAVLVVLTNFYFFVLYFAAERLKIAFVFFFLSLVILNKRKLAFFSAFLSVLTHAQMAIIYSSMVFEKIFSPILNGKVKKSSLIISIALSIPIFLLFEHMSRKYLFYSAIAAEKGVTDLMRILMFFGVAFYYAQNKKESVLIFAPIIIAVLLVGGDRVNMMGYFIFLYYALKYNRGINWGVLISSAYFTFATFQFIGNILARANGFDFG